MYGYADPGYRYRRDTTSMNTAQNYSPVQNNYSHSTDRYAKFRSQPVNFSRVDPDSHISSNLNNSNIYTKQGLLKRN